MTRPPVANARMYSATASVRADWNALLGWVLAQAGLRWDIIDHDAPAPLATLWTRNDLGLAMMCGLPYAQRIGTPGQPTLVAAPIPTPARYGGQAVYFTDIVVRSDAPYRTLQDTFGGTVGYTLADSMSGGVALRRHLEGYRTPQQPRLYRAAVGDLVNARGVIEALAAGRIDVGPLDSYYHDLLWRHEPGFAAQVRIVAHTPALPIPPLIATAALSAGELARLRQALLASAASEELAPVMERLLLAGFAFPDLADYRPLAAMAAAAATPFEEL
ncbi:PhnD/SsuA/transferrin family substrate-binding protein [Polaromonas sp.]|uniref:phosphate/phosphite/phosphonate ABC transporter substrate-binding protein n=1 Tax=Polaromonas sp. TaxID=1869339 RepID=UPI0017C5239B|nr:PhnD/SsuA/transferrin family substrate-binding protein [Polaromonas sp.]NMM06531.1 phosphate/phosphite/phosphonate ABC transporter substrate-binding protein [Polaromonas sp.]